MILCRHLDFVDLHVDGFPGHALHSEIISNQRRFTVEREVYPLKKINECF